MNHVYKKLLIILAFVGISIVIAPLIINWAYTRKTIVFNTVFTAVDLLVYYGAILTFVGTISLGGLALWQNNQIHNHYIETLEPQLSMKLVDINHLLYLVVTNTGASVAKNIKIDVEKISNNGDINVLNLDGLFDSVFELYPNESVQGRIAISGENIVTAIFPRVILTVTYLREDIVREKTYTRTVVYNNDCAEKVIADVNLDTHKIESDAAVLARASVRIANYLDGYQLARIDELDLLAGKSLYNDIVSAITSKELTEIHTRTQTIEDACNIRREKENENGQT